MVPSLPAVSRPCSTTRTLFSLAPQSSSWSWNSSSPSDSNRLRAWALVTPFGGAVGISSRRTRLVFLRQLLPREQRFVEAEAGEIADAHRVEHAVEVVDFVLDHTGMEVLHLALERLAVLVEPGIAQALEARHPAAHAGHRQAALPAFLDLVGERLEHRVDQHRVRHFLDAGIARVGLHAE